MRLATGFFAKYNNIAICDRVDALQIDLPQEWKAWFFMPSRQIFFCFQDPAHLCTKLRNRILSDTFSLLIGKEEVSIEVLMELIESKLKLVHGLVKTDFNPKDRQNFTSCLNLSDDEAAMAEWLRCLTCIHKVLCSNLGTTSHGMTLDKSLTALCLGSPVR